MPTSKPISLEENFSCSSKSLAQKRPCQDYHTFKNDRKPEHFKVGQIWGAQYRANLPHNFRYTQVACNSARSVLVTWLKPIPISNGKRRWCDAGLPVACGSFEYAKQLYIPTYVETQNSKLQNSNMYLLIHFLELS